MLSASWKRIISTVIVNTRSKKWRIKKTVLETGFYTPMVLVVVVVVLFHVTLKAEATIEAIM